MPPSAPTIRSPVVKAALCTGVPVVLSTMTPSTVCISFIVCIPPTTIPIISPRNIKHTSTAARVSSRMFFSFLLSSMSPWSDFSNSRAPMQPSWSLSIPLTKSLIHASFSSTSPSPSRSSGKLCKILVTSSMLSVSPWCAGIEWLLSDSGDDGGCCFWLWFIVSPCIGSPSSCSGGAAVPLCRRRLADICSELAFRSPLSRG
mmetsp:Transcript_23559/g.65339  ORF Transcript_23559/g.65339 Transcript_23559/m.65339 type:complete len:202 (-) Transcript_23559:533-1138(-)